MKSLNPGRIANSQEPKAADRSTIRLNLPRMINKEAILSEAKKFLSNQVQLNVESISIDAGLKSLGLDSFRIIELVLFIERRTGLTFPDYAYTPANLKSLESIVNCFISLQK